MDTYESAARRQIATIVQNDLIGGIVYKRAQLIISRGIGEGRRQIYHSILRLTKFGIIDECELVVRRMKDVASEQYASDRVGTYRNVPLSAKISGKFRRANEFFARKADLGRTAALSPTELERPGASTRCQEPVASLIWPAEYTDSCLSTCSSAARVTSRCSW